MSFLRAILMVGDPLIVAFIVSVLIGVVFKYSSGKLFLKYGLTFVAFMGYLILYVYADQLQSNEIIRYIVMFGPIALIIGTIILAFIIAPKENNEESTDFDKNYETKKFFTGWDSMFPNDIDEYDKHPK